MLNGRYRITKSEAYYTAKGYKPKGSKECEFCGVEFTLYITRDMTRKRFCSYPCRMAYEHEHNGGKYKPDLDLLHSPEVRAKAGETVSRRMRLGLIPYPPEPTPESRIKAGLKIRGVGNGRWITDRSLVKRARFNNSDRAYLGSLVAWRNDVFRRDDWTCQDCEIRGGRLNAHHIKSWADSPDDRFIVANGVTLCHECHRQRHKKEVQNAAACAK